VTSKPGDELCRNFLSTLWDGLYSIPQNAAAKGCKINPMLPCVRQTLLLASIVAQACCLAACGTVNERLAAGVSDAIPAWAGGLPADAPPRPGTAKYDEYMRERERRRLLPASERDTMPQGHEAIPGQAIDEGHR
jgi:hypothetical protein